MQKKHILFFVLMLQVSLLGAQSVIEYKVISVPLFTSTPYQITCNRFEKSFSEKKKISIKSSTALEQMELLFSKFEHVEGVTSIDVRGKIILMYDDRHTQVLCFDQFGHFLKNGVVFKNKKLLSYLLTERIIVQ